MTVPSKSKNAPTAGPDGPARTSATASASDTGDLRPERRVERLGGAYAREQIAHVRRGLLTARRQVRAAALEQAVILGQLQRGAKQLSRQRLRSVQASLQQHLPPDGLALIEESVGLDRVSGITGGQPLGDDELRVEEGAQHPVRHQES